MCPITSLALLLAIPMQDAGAQKTRIVFHESSAIDLYFHARAPAPASFALAELGPAIEAASALDRSLGGWMLAWGPLDGSLRGCATVADVKAAFARADETIELRGGVRVELRGPALELADALLAAEGAFREPWKEHARHLTAARARWEEIVGPKERALLDFHLASLGMDDPGLELPVYLVCAAPRPGAVTMRDEEGRGVSFVAVGSAEGSQLLEIVLHEATHSLDLASGGRSVLDELRARLEEAGVDARDPAMRDLPHTVMFVQAAESYRRVVDPAHVDYGETAGVYARGGARSEAVRGFWRDHLDGKLTRAQALDGIVASLQPAPR